MRDRLLYLIIIAGLYGAIGSIVLVSLDRLLLLKTVVGTIVVTVTAGLTFGCLMLMKLRKNPEAYNWLDPGLKLTRLKEKEKSNESYFAYPKEKRILIVNHYRDVQEEGRILNKDAWAKLNYNITGKTLKEYEDEFPKRLEENRVKRK